MVVQWHTSITLIPILKQNIRLDIWRCDGPERHEMLTVINAYYQVCQILHYTSSNINVKFNIFN